MRHLRALCAIADTGSVHKAARQLGMTQPSLTTQLRRIEQSIGGQLFTRARTGSCPTPLGRTVLSRARPLLAGMSALVSDARSAAGQFAATGPRLRLGSTGSRAIPGWLRRVRGRLPETDTSIHMDVSANTLLRMLAAGQLDAVFVHEVEGVPLHYPTGVVQRVLVQREPQFVAIPEHHPAAARPQLRLADLAADRWMVDPAVDGDRAGLQRMFDEAGLEPRVVYGDYLAARDLVAGGEVVSPVQPTSQPRSGMTIRPLLGDPLAVRLVLASHSGADVETGALFTDLKSAYGEAACASAAYRSWLRRHPGAVPVPLSGAPAPA